MPNLFFAFQTDSLPARKHLPDWSTALRLQVDHEQKTLSFPTYYQIHTESGSRASDPSNLIINVNIPGVVIESS